MQKIKLLIGPILIFCSTITHLDSSANSLETKKITEFTISQEVAQRLFDAITISGKAINQNVDSFFTQLNISAEKANPAIIKLGHAMTEAGKPMHKQIIITTAALATISLAGAALTYVCQKYVQRYLFEPELIERKSSRGIIPSVTSWFRTNSVMKLKNHMVMDKNLESTLTYVMKMASNTVKNGGQFENILLWGKPGTGKTLFAELLAEFCGMDFAIIPAAKISTFFKDNRAAEKLDELFAWAANGKNGTILFFDEAETFLANRSTLSNEAQNALNEFLQKTGTPSHKILIVAATNRPEILDPAVLDRFGTTIEFKLPDQEARIQQLHMHIEKIFTEYKKNTINYDLLQDETFLYTFAQKLNECSGRTIQQCVNRILQYALAQDTYVITPDIVDAAIAQTFSKNAMQLKN